MNKAEGMYRRGLVWPIAALSCAVVVAAIALLWGVRPSLLSVGIPAGATLIAAIMEWAHSAPLRNGQSTLDQLEHARQALADRTVAQLHGLIGSTGSDPPLPSLAHTLPVSWAISPPSEIDDTTRCGTDNAAMMAKRLRSGQSRRLIILGDPGCGKTTLMRLIMAELLEHSGAQDPVPVYVELAAWNPTRYSLREWIARRIREVLPELQYKSDYGSTAVTGLIYHRRVLPVLDGLDTLPKALRRLVMSSDDFLQQSQLILACRTQEFREAIDGFPIADATIFTPGRVPSEEAQKFLQGPLNELSRWSRVFDTISDDPQSYLALALSTPRTIYLADIVYRDRDPEELMTDSVYSCQADVEGCILRKIPQALATNEQWAESCPWYRDKAIKWLHYLAIDVCDPDTGELTWGSIFRATPRLYRRQVAIRALASSLLACMLIAFFNRYRGSFTTYGWLTGAAYGLAIASACIFLAPPHPSQHDLSFRRPAYGWWIRRKLAVLWRAAMASLTGGFLFGLTITIRSHILHGAHSNSTGLVDGIVAGMVVGLCAVIAGIPSAPRTGPLTRLIRATDRPSMNTRIYSLSTWASIGVASSLGILFGLISGVLAVVEHQNDPRAPHMVTGLVYGLIMGLNFAVGTWLVGLARTRTISRCLTDPKMAFRAERWFTLLAMVILSLTFASAFSLNSSLGWSQYSAIPNGLVGAIVGSLVSEWPLYIAAITIMAVRRKTPLRLMKFLELCRSQGVMQPVGISYRFRERIPWTQLVGGNAISTTTTTAGGPLPGVASAKNSESGWRAVRSYLSSRRRVGCVLTVAACAVSMRIALTWIPPSGLASRELPLAFMAGTAAVIGFSADSPFGERKRKTRTDPILRLAAVIALTCAAIAMFVAASMSAHLADGTLGILRNLAGLTGIALLSAAVFGDAMAWVIPAFYLLATLYALEHAWTTPWLWPARPQHNLAASACAALIFATGVVITTIYGTPSTQSRPARRRLPK